MVLVYILPDHAEAMIDEFLCDCPFADTIQDSGTELPESLQSAAYKAEPSSRAVLESAGHLAKGQRTGDNNNPDEAFLMSPQSSVAASEHATHHKIGAKVSAEEAFGEAEKSTKEAKGQLKR